MAFTGCGGSDTDDQDPAVSGADTPGSTAPAATGPDLAASCEQAREANGVGADYEFGTAFVGTDGIECSFVLAGPTSAGCSPDETEPPCIVKFTLEA